MAVYDSAKTREIAHGMGQLIDRIDTDVKFCVRKSMTYTDGFRGKTAQAMERQLSDLMRQLMDFEDDLEVLRHRVNMYADALELADKRLADQL